MTRLVIAGAMAFAMALPVLAAEEYFVALDTSSKQCRVMSIQPDGTTMKLVGGKSYPTLAEAQTAMSLLPECNG